MRLKTALMICLSSILLSGCISLPFSKKTVWVIPSAPQTKKVNFVPMTFNNGTDSVTNGFYINGQDATNLVNNVDEMKAYEKKLRLLLDKMARLYNIKLEEVNSLEK